MVIVGCLILTSIDFYTNRNGMDTLKTVLELIEENRN